MYEYVNIPTLVNAALIGLGGMVIRWGVKLDRSISATDKSTAALAERLNGHETLDDARHEGIEARLDDLNDRVRWYR